MASVLKKRHLANRRVNIRRTHPNLYFSIMVLAFGEVALGINFFIFTPTFDPYGIPKEAVGVVFLALGLSQLIFLNVFRNLKMVRIMLAVSISFMFFWGIGNTEQFFNGKASLQLPIMFFVVSVLQIPLLIEAPVNPMTEKKKQ